jgi:large subunit ribosomal protein L6
MSRLGRTPIELPKGVEVKIVKENVQVKGPKGMMPFILPPGVSAKIEGDLLVMELDENISPSSALYGLYRSLVRNAVIGVTQGFEKKLTLIGVGYRAAVNGTRLDLQVGFSHPTGLDIPQGIQVAVEKGVAITIKGIDAHEVGQFAAAVRAIKPPEPYKGKGIRYEGEFVRKKEGKAAKGKV